MYRSLCSRSDQPKLSPAEMEREKTRKLDLMMKNIKDTVVY